MTARRAFDEATKATAINGEVVLRGPDGVALSMTPRAARETAQRLKQAAEEAESQAAPGSVRET